MIQFSLKSFERKCETMPKEYREDVLAVAKLRESLLWLSEEHYRMITQKYAKNAIAGKGEGITKLPVPNQNGKPIIKPCGNCSRKRDNGRK